jgi:hypothetical protein
MLINDAYYFLWKSQYSSMKEVYLLALRTGTNQ